MKNIFLLFAAALFSVALAACGGGGGISGISPEPPEIRETDPTPHLPTPFSDNTPFAIGKAKKGSVIQSTDKDAAGVTKTDLGFEVMRNPDADPDNFLAHYYGPGYGRHFLRIIHTDSDGDVVPDWTVTSLPHASLQESVLVGGYIGRTADAPATPPRSEWYSPAVDSAPRIIPHDSRELGGAAGDYLFVHAEIVVTIETPDGINADTPYSEDVRVRNALRRAHFDKVEREIDNGDWFAFGYWLYAPETVWNSEGHPVTRIRRGDFHLGVFADGEKLIEHDINAGAGTAKYTGQAQMTFSQHGPYDNFAYSHVRGRISLQSDFAERKISGGAVLDQHRGLGGIQYRLVLDLHEADISEGFFEGEFTMESAGRTSGRRCPNGGPCSHLEYIKPDLDDYEPIKYLQDVTGHWGGNFSHSDGPDDVPDFAIGTFGGKDAESGADVFGTFLTGCAENCDDVAPAPAPTD